MTYDLPEELQVTQDGAVRILTLNRPEQLNAVNPPLHRALIDVWSQLANDPDARAVVITGAGRAFSAGGDMRMIRHNATDFDGRHAVLRETKTMLRQIIDCHLPIVAAVNGPAVGLGASLGAMCDVVFMADDAYMADPHVAVGLVAGDGGVATWPLATSLLRAKEYLLTGDRMSAADAERFGLVNHVVPAAEVLDRSLAFAQRLAALPAFAVQGTKAALNTYLQRSFTDIVPFALAAQSESFTSDDVERITSEFIDKKGRGD